MLSGVFYGAQYGGSTTAILVKIPGETSSVVTMLDGHAMAQQGRAGPALAIAALASLFAGSVVTLWSRSPAPPLAEVALLFQLGRLCLGDAAGAGLGGGPGARLGAQGGRDDRARHAVRRRRHRHIRPAPTGSPSARHPVRRLGFVPVSMGMFGLGRDHGQPGARRRQCDLRQAGHADCGRRRQDLRASCRRWCAAPRSALPSASCRAAGRPSRRSPPIRWRRRCPRTPERFGKGAIEGVAGAGGRQQRGRADRASSRCSASASRPTR